MPWPDDDVFFLETGDGLFLCRNHEFFTSSVPAPNPPCELAAHRAFMKVKYPRIPQSLMELAVGFFYRVYKQHGSEAGLLLAWNRKRERMRLVCPQQEATVSRGWTGVYPIGLFYEIPDLGDDLLIGDLHSHADESAYASHTDKTDEQDRGSAIHVVVGKLSAIDADGQIDLHVDGVVDGTRFNVPPGMVIEGCGRPRQDVPRHWIKRVKITTYDNRPKTYNDYYGDYLGYGSSYNDPVARPGKLDDSDDARGDSLGRKGT